MTFSLSIAHTPWIQARRENLARMLLDLLPMSAGVPYLNHDTDYRAHAWQDIKHEWALKAWRWHCKQDVTHCVLLSDDLAVAPHFWEIVGSMVRHVPYVPIGLMSNHPDGPKVYESGGRWYACNAWLVGPGIIMPREMLSRFVSWYEGWYPNLAEGNEHGQKGFMHDDSSLNYWITFVEKTCSLHPVPAPIEHQLYLGRSHDPSPFPKHAAEWISWKRIWHDNPRRDVFSELPKHVVEDMRRSDYWADVTAVPMLEVV